MFSALVCLARFLILLTKKTIDPIGSTTVLSFVVLSMNIFSGITQDYQGYDYFFIFASASAGLTD